MIHSSPPKKKVAAWIKGTKEVGGTNLYDALELGFEVAQAGSNRPALDTIYFLTDGKPTAGKFQDPQRILKRVRDDPRHRERRIAVPTQRLETLLRSQGFEAVDYCSIDVEGAERAVLEGFDFGAFDIRVISAENATNSDAESLRDILQPAGFRLVAILGADEIWSRL